MYVFKVIIASLALLGLAVSAASLPPKSEYYNDIVVDACLRYMDSSSGGRHQIVEVRNYKSNHQFYVSFTGDFLVTQYKPDSKPVFKTCDVEAKYYPWSDRADVKKLKCVERLEHE